MSKHFYAFSSGSSRRLVALPMDLDEMIAGWCGLRRVMIRQRPDAFTRDEWAYLISFLDQSHLMAPFLASFGTRAEQPLAAPCHSLLRPRGDVAVWLPNNVSLLGPLSLVMLSLTGNQILAKGGTLGDDLTQPFLEFVQEHAPEGPLRDFVTSRIAYMRFSRTSEQNGAWAARAKVRIVFGSDAAVLGVEQLPHPVDSTGIAFSDRRSEVWLSPAAASDAQLQMLLKVFAIYGRAGCTSPARVVLLDATRDDALALQARLAALWETLFPPPAAHVASANVMAYQWAKALGWEASLVAQNGAVLAVGSCAQSRDAMVDAAMFLPIVTATAAQAIASLPENIQTLGHGLDDAASPIWLERVAQTSIKRFVPIGQMHHFGHVWDGWSFWQRTFEEVEFTL